jgi:hypothetical protein
MLRRALIAGAVFLAFAALSSAHAGVPIPCSGSPTLQATDLRGVKDASGQDIVLYYYIVACTSSRWESYRTRDGKYHPLTPGLRSSLPAPPGFWASAWQNKAKFWVEWLWLVIAAFVVGTLSSKLPDWTAPMDPDPGDSRHPSAGAARRRR